MTSDELENKAEERVRPSSLKQICSEECKERSAQYTKMTQDYCHQFRIERFSCIALSFIGVALLVVVTAIAIRNTQPDFKSIATLSAGVVGSGGFITYGIRSLFSFMDRADKAISRYL